MNRAVFLDRDGVLIEDVHLLTRSDQVRIPPGVPEALRALKSAGFLLVMVSNQTVVSRGLASEAEVKRVNDFLNEQLVEAGAPPLDAVYVCPHHPKATRVEYRKDCECRKPRAGLLLAAAGEHQINLADSYMVGDRITDIIAGAKAGCRTVLVETGKHNDAPIESAEPIDSSIVPDYTCEGLLEAAKWIVAR